MEREGITIVHFVPPMLRAFLDAGEAGRCRTVRRVFASGEALGRDLADRALEAFRGAEVHNLYGPTEAAIEVTFHDVTHGGGPVPIGAPTANTRMYVLDPAGNPQPGGIAGELHIGGVQVGRGYLGRPALTAEKFIPDAFGAPGARLYRTGDRARWLPNGEIEYLGRIDFQVKVRGFRIEPGEIETVLLDHEGVGAAVVVARDAAGGEKVLAAYVTGQGGAPVDVPELKEFLGQRLPEYMVPGVFVVLDHLPISPNGKVDRKALPAPESAGGERRYVAPRTAAEQVLAGIWKDVLGVERVGADDDFFALGGHSLVATRIVSRAGAAFGVQLPLRAVFEAPTLAALAGRIDALTREGADADLPPILPVPRDGDLPLSFGQQRLWFIQQMDPESAAYNMPMALRVSGALDADALAWTLTEITRRHEVLRTVFRVSAQGDPVQVVLAPAPFPLARADLSSAPAELREGEARRLAGVEALRPFDLARGPLLRCTLLRLAADDWVVLFTMHHVVSDGWSMGLLVREVSALYGARVSGRPSPLAPLPVQYADYAAWQRTVLRGEALERRMEYWRGALEGAPAALDLPADHPRPAQPAHRGHTVQEVLPNDLAEGLARRSQAESATLNMTLMAAFAALLFRYTGQEKVVIGSPTANRGRAEIEGLIGFFVNLLPIAVDLSGDPTLGEVVRRVRATALEAYTHQDVPFDHLVEVLPLRRVPGVPPLVQVLFSLEHLQDAEPELPGVSVRPLEAGEGESVRFDLSLSAIKAAEGMGVALSYDTALFEEDTARRMLRHFVAMAAALASSPEARLLDVALDDAADDAGDEPGSTDFDFDFAGA
jgi:acyl carrier protein